MRVPFVDLQAQYRAHQREFDEALQAVVRDTAFIGGRYVRDFEAAFASALGIPHCISVANGTDAIYIVLKMLGIGPGDEVITTALSWIATSETITQTGARPVFVDIGPDFTLAVELIEAAITPRTRAIIPVHLYGQPADLEPLLAVAKRSRLHVVEDCAQAHFAKYSGRFVGSYGVAGTFSFYPGKNLGAYGDAGAIVTNNDELATKCRMYANHGALVKHEHRIEGVNSRLDGLQASLLSAKLAHIGSWTTARQRIAADYDVRLRGIPEVQSAPRRDGTLHVFHLYVIRAKRRDELRSFLSERGIETGIHYPTALPYLEAYRYVGARPETFPAAWKAQHEIVSLPMYPEMTGEMVEFVCSSIRKFYAG